MIQVKNLIQKVKVECRLLLTMSAARISVVGRVPEVLAGTTARRYTKDSIAALS